METVFISFSVRNNSVSEFFIELANELSKKRKVVIITDCLQPHPFLISPEIEIFKRPSTGPNNWRVFLFLYRLFSKYKPSVIIGNFSSVGPLMILGKFFKARTRIAWCHSISKQFLSRRPLIDKKRIVYALSTNIFANSNATKEDLIKTFKISPGKIRIVSNAIRKSEIKKFPLQPLGIVYAGRMDASKGVETLLQAMPEVVKIYPEIKLKLIGGYLKTEKLESLRHMAKSLNLDTNVIFHGFQPRTSVLEEFSKSYLTVVPSLVEAFGYVVIESFSVSTPVIGSNTSGIAEIIRDGKDGFLFEPGNYKELSEKIIFLLQNEDLRQEFSHNCFERFQNNYELTGVINKAVRDIENLSHENR